MENKSRYVIIFINDSTGSEVYLSYNADIDKICYAKNPQLPGTTKIGYAKSYSNIQSAKDDIYKLRYHFRDFIKIKTIIAKTSEPEITVAELSDNISNYKFTELKAIK